MPSNALISGTILECDKGDEIIEKLISCLKEKQLTLEMISYLLELTKVEIESRMHF